jgi:UDP-N-acetylmuramoylalanine--D-glutamate ligase
VTESLAVNVKQVYLIGSAADAMARAWGETVPCGLCGDIDTAARSAWKDADPGETILLSPGCASFDQFRDFEDRGDTFKKLVRLMEEEV